MGMCAPIENPPWSHYLLLNSFHVVKGVLIADRSPALAVEESQLLEALCGAMAANHRGVASFLIPLFLRLPTLTLTIIMGSKSRRQFSDQLIAEALFLHSPEALIDCPELKKESWYLLRGKKQLLT